MNDFEHETLKSFVSMFNTYDELYDKYISHYKIGNKDSLLQFFTYAKGNEEAWNIYKYLKSDDTLKLFIKTYNDIDSIYNELNNYDLSNFKRVIVRLDNKTYKDISRLKDLNIDVLIFLNGDKGLCTIDEFINMREFFDYFKDEYSKYELSPLEKVTICYDYVKFFQYNEELKEECLTESRSIVKSINNGRIVCESYAKIFSQLLSELNIGSNLMYVYQNHDENQKHVRPIVYIKDDKYELDDYYLFDPTWDSYDNNIESEFSTIKYDYYLININDYNLYFKDETISRIVDYKSDKNVNINIGSILNFQFGKEKFNSLIRKTKRVEGYSQEQIDDYLKDVFIIRKMALY